MIGDLVVLVALAVLLGGAGIVAGILVGRRVESHLAASSEREEAASVLGTAFDEPVGPGEADDEADDAADDDLDEEAE